MSVLNTLIVAIVSQCTLMSKYQVTRIYLKYTQSYFHATSIYRGWVEEKRKTAFRVKNFKMAAINFMPSLI